MCAWGASFQSCEDLIARIERNDPFLRDLTILPTKAFGDAELNRLSAVLEKAAEKLHWRSLSASGHAVSSAALKRFGTAIASASASGYSQLCSIALGNSATGDDGVKALVAGLLTEAVSAACSLETMDLSYKGMGVAGMHALAALAEACPNVRVLNLSRNGFQLDDGDGDGERSNTAWTPAIFRRVSQLDLSACALDERFARTVFPLLVVVPGEPPRTLRLDNNPLGDAGFEALLRSSSSSGSSNSSLSGLYASNCRLTDLSMVHLAAASSQLTECKVLDVSGNALTAEGATVLGDCFFKAKTNARLLSKLTEVNLSGNVIGATGVQAVVAGLGEWGLAAGRCLESLDLSQTECGTTGAVAAVQSARHVRLRSLRLYSNTLGSEGFVEIAAVLGPVLSASECCLQTLDLAGNGADQASVVALLHALLDALTRTTTELVVVHLGCLVIGGNQGGEDVEEVVRQIRSIRPAMDIARDKIKKHGSR